MVEAKLFKYFLFLIVITSSCASNETETHPNLQLLPKDCGAINEDRVISDRPHFEEFPWLTLITFKKDGKTRFVCDGTLINSKYVMTTAHCVRNIDISGVRIGDYNIETELDCEGTGAERSCASPYQDLDLEEIAVYPDYQPKIARNDIALIRLKKSVNFSDCNNFHVEFLNVAYKYSFILKEFIFTLTPRTFAFKDIANSGAICLPTTSDLRSRDLSNVSGTLAGWNLLNKPSHLLKAHTTIYSEEDCRKQFEESGIIRWFSNQLCARGVPYLESGAPLMVKSDFPDHQKYVQYGILSYEDRKSKTENYIDVRKYMEWILDTIKP